MATLPEVQERLRVLAAQTNAQAEEISALAEEISRRPRVTQAPQSADPMTPAKRRAIRRLHLADPTLTHAEIARRLNINPGRVSETLAGKRR